MLINKSSKIEKGDLATFKLVNGDEIVASVAEVGDDTFTVENPMSVVPAQKGVGLYPSLITARDNPTVILHKNHILMMCLTVDEIKAHYIKMTTGIVTAPQGIIA